MSDGLFALACFAAMFGLWLIGWKKGLKVTRSSVVRRDENATLFRLCAGIYLVVILFGFALTVCGLAGLLN